PSRTVITIVPITAAMPNAAKRIMAVNLWIGVFRHEWHDRHIPSKNSQGVGMLKKVVCLALPGTAPFEFGVVCEVFGIDRSEMGGPSFDFAIATADPGPVVTSLGYSM